MRPSHSAYVVKPPPEGGTGKARWTEVGAIWPHKNGTGFDLVLFDQISVAGRLVCTARKNRDNGGPEDGS